MERRRAASRAACASWVFATVRLAAARRAAAESLASVEVLLGVLRLEAAGACSLASSGTTDRRRADVTVASLVLRSDLDGLRTERVVVDATDRVRGIRDPLRSGLRFDEPSIPNSDASLPLLSFAARPSTSIDASLRFVRRDGLDLSARKMALGIFVGVKDGGASSMEVMLSSMSWWAVPPDSPRAGEPVMVGRVRRVPDSLIVRIRVPRDRLLEFNSELLRESDASLRFCTRCAVVGCMAGIWIGGRGGGASSFGDSAADSVCEGASESCWQRKSSGGLTLPRLRPIRLDALVLMLLRR